MDEVKPSSATSPGRPSKENSDLVAGAFLAFAAMMFKDYGVGKDYAMKALEVAYDMTEPA